MGQILHGSATTTHAVRAAIQRSKAPLKELAARHGLNHKTVAKWRKRAFVHDAPMGPRMVRSMVLAPEEKAIIVAFRRHTLLPLDDCLYALQATLPNLTRSSLHCCLKRHGISRPPQIAGDKPARQPFKPYPFGYFHIDITEVRTDEGKLHLFVGVDRTSKFAFAQLHPAATVQIAADFLRAVIEAVPYKIQSVLTDNGVQFGDMPQHRSGPSARYTSSTASASNTASSTASPSPITRGPTVRFERMNRTLKEATVRRYHYDSHQQLRQHLAAFLEPTTSPGGSRPYTASRPSKPSARLGVTSQIALDTTQPTSPRD